MKLYKSNKSKYLFGLFCIIAIYTLYYVYVADNVNYDVNKIPRKLRHVIKFVTTIAVYIVGSFHLGQIREKWLAILWHIVHISLLFTITSFGLYDWFIYPLTQSFKDLAQSMQEFLISPVLYVAMGILNKR
jgi:hypothetical protein